MARMEETLQSDAEDCDEKKTWWTEKQETVVSV
jgi:hypothetical protein